MLRGFRFVSLVIVFAVFSLFTAGGGCDRSASPAIAPVQPVPARGPGPAPSPSTEPAPPPKEAPANLAPDAPQSPTAAAPQIQDKPATPLADPAKDKPPATAKPAPRARVIRPTTGSEGCVEMYGTCTPPPDRLCTSTALHVDCGQRSQVPSSGEWVQCVCGG